MQAKCDAAEGRQFTVQAGARQAYNGLNVDVEYVPLNDGATLKSYFDKNDLFTVRRNRDATSECRLQR